MVTSPMPWQRMLVRASCLALIVGTVLMLINHGDHLAREPICAGFYWKLALSYAVPFTVSLISTLLAQGDARRLSRPHDSRSTDR
ncbi:MAG: nitrate/nitrite transporter NrtS [Myxococcales bacterium]|jgi:hypothetical protein|nr:nitrate/nitrite transporter NrtS [Myxococcales bacterium]MBK7197567.1 nitrate/nitrite transporter NrtS [Myxococcales bacterium]MBP6842929.1 nitrate/nitrite transporter NrtS [Kofleriaceae bacterium]